MKSYTHLTMSERIYLEESYKAGKSIRWIAKNLGRSPSTISRELRRNWSKKAKRYNSWHAYIEYTNRRKRCHRKNHLLHNEEARQFVQDGFRKHDWSPEIIAERWNENHISRISFNSIYRAVYTGLLPGITAKNNLMRRGKSYSDRRKTSKSHPESPIHDRPEIVEHRARLGDLEGDTVYGSVGKGYLVVAVDRRSRLLMAAIARDKSAESTNEAFLKALSQVPFPLHTLTLDNGTEFAKYQDLEKELGIKVYFADTHSPWQRGSNENINGLIRRYFPRGTNFNEVSDERLAEVLDLINRRPRKCLGFRSPLEFLR